MSWKRCFFLAFGFFLSFLALFFSDDYLNSFVIPPLISLRIPWGLPPIW